MLKVLDCYWSYLVWWQHNTTAATINYHSYFHCWLNIWSTKHLKKKNSLARDMPITISQISCCHSTKHCSIWSTVQNPKRIMEFNGGNPEMLQNLTLLFTNYFWLLIIIKMMIKTCSQKRTRWAHTEPFSKQFLKDTILVEVLWSAINGT